MKKLFYWFFMLCFLLNIQKTFAQVSAYTFTQTAGTYTPITGGTVLFTGTFDDDNSSAITIPSFTFNGTAYTQMYVNTNGFLVLGTTEPTPATYRPISSTDIYQVAISPFGQDLNQAASGTPGIHWQQVGNEIIVQWTDVRRYNVEGERISFQARLNTTNGEIKYIYGGTITASTDSSLDNIQVGLRGANNTFPANVNNRSITETGGSWINSTTGTSNSSSMYFSGTTPTVPVVGLTYTFMTPVACNATPVAGTTASNSTTTCGNSVTLSLIGGTIASSITYQWQSSPDGMIWTDISGSTSQTAVVTPLVTTQYRCVVNCSGFGNTANSTPITITVTAPTYATVPYTQSFENQWSSTCNVSPFGEAIPDNSWRNNPLSGNASWRADNTTTVLSGWSGTFGMYSPAAQSGNRSARFHSFDVTSNGVGTLDLYVNLSTAGTKQLGFYYINPTSNFTNGDKLELLLSTDGGLTFNPLTSTPAMAVGGTAVTSWTYITADIASTTTTGVIRFKATGDFGSGAADIGLDNISITTACTALPTAGITNASQTSICSGNVDLSLTGNTAGLGISYQWQSNNGSWVDIAGAISPTYTVSPITTTQYRCVITCAGFGSSNSTPIIVTVLASTYATLPYTQTFENQWITSCNVAPLGEELPDASWKNTPVSGNNSWRADNTTAALSGWGNLTGYLYSPTGSQASMRSARFHSGQASSGLVGTLDLYVNASNASNKLLSFDYIDVNGTDALELFISTDGGANFSPLVSSPTILGNVMNWTNVTANITSTSATTVIRFKATADFGSTDIGLDNVNIVLPCTGTPNAGTSLPAITLACATTNLSLSGVTIAAGLTYQWQSSTTNATTGFTNVASATNNTYNAPAPSQTTWYRCVVTCSISGLSANSIAAQLNVFNGINVFPYNENFDAITTTNTTTTSPIPTNAVNPTNSSLPCGWLVENVNADNNTWKNANTLTGASSAPNSLVYNYNSTNAANDWVYTPALSMVAGRTYNVTFKFKSGSSSYVEKLEVRWGNAQANASMLVANSIFNNDNIDNNTYQTATCTGIVPTISGNYYVGFKAYSDADQFNLFIDDVQIIEVCPTIAITNASLPNAIINNTYNQTLAQTGLSGAGIVWSVSAGTLPAGLTLNASTGVISGTATTIGTSNFTIQVAQGSCLQTKAYTIVVSCPTTITISPTTLPSGLVSTAYNATISQTGLVGTVVWSATGLPSPLVIDANTGVISGTPTATSNTTITVTVTGTGGASNCFATINYNLVIACANVTFTPNTLPNATIGTAYPQTLSQTGLSGVVTWSVSTGSLPAGLSMNNAGVISGTPTATGTSNFTVSITNGICSIPKTYSIVTACPTLVISPASLTNPLPNQAYSQMVNVSGNTQPITYSVSVGSLPAGLSLNTTTGEISGTITAIGTATFTILVSQSAGLCSSSQAYTLTTTCITNSAGITPNTFPNGVQNAAYSQQLSQTNYTGLTAAIVWSLDSGTLPTGITIDANGLISGTTTQIGTFAIVIRVTQGICSTTKNYSLVFNAPCPAISLNPAQLPVGNVNSQYVSTTLTVTGGVAPYTFAVVTGTLPAGLTLNSGSISGTPTATGTSNVTISATDANGCSGTTTYSIVINAACGTLVFNPNALTSSTATVSYAQNISVTGGVSPYTIVLTTGTLPAGLTFSSGAINGTTTITGATNLTFTATDANGCVVTKNYILTVNPFSTKIINVTGNLAFGDVLRLQTETRIMRIANTGTQAIAVTGITFPQYFSGAFSGTIAAGAFQDVTVTFAPTITALLGSVNGIVTVLSDATSGTATIPVSGVILDNPNALYEVSKSYVNVYPNPGTDINGNFNLKFDNGFEGNYRLTILDNKGQITEEESFEITNTNEIKTLKAANWANGMYFILIENKKGNNSLLKVIKR